MKTRPPVSTLGRRRRRPTTPTRSYRTLIDKLGKVSPDDLLPELRALSVTRQQPHPPPNASIRPSAFTTPEDLKPAVAQTAENVASKSEPGLDTSTPSESQTLQDDQLPDPFRNPLEIPRVMPHILAYPHSGSAISGAFHDRFREIQNYFRLNTEKHPDLKAHVEHIDYALKMCGSSVDDSHPSILVFCRPSEFKTLRSLLNEKHLKRQWCRRKSSPPYHFWKAWRKKDVASSDLETSDHKPLFDLYFWRTSRPRNILCLQTSSVFLGVDETTPLTLSGTVMSVPHDEGKGLSVSTIGCVIQVDSSYYGLTAAHVLRGARRVPKSSGSGSCFDQHGLLSEDIVDSSSDDDLLSDPGSSYRLDDGGVDDFVSDVEYDDCGESDIHEEAGQLSADETSIISDREDEERPDITCTAISSGHIFSATSCGPDYDWALVALEREELLRPNIFPGNWDSNVCHPVLFSNVAEDLPKVETAVLIATSRGIQKAVLQPDPVFLGGIASRSNMSATYWSVIASDGTTLCLGDSGSLVLDATTHAVYGHVVASNPLGEVYISPLTSAMNQIKYLLGAEHVHLPQALPLLASLTNRYLGLRDCPSDVLERLHALFRTVLLNDNQSTQPLQSWDEVEGRQALSKMAQLTVSAIEEPERSEHIHHILTQRRRHVSIFGEGPSPTFGSMNESSPRPFIATVNHTPDDNRVLTLGEKSKSDKDPKTETREEYLARRELEFPGTSVISTFLHPDSADSEFSQRREALQPGFIPSDAFGDQETQERVHSPPTRRMSMDEDIFYTELLTSIPAEPPTYSTFMRNHGGWKTQGSLHNTSDMAFPGDETLPDYQCDIHIEGVFMQKMEIENVHKRAEYRAWQMVYAVLHGTALVLYQVKKEKGWWARRKHNNGLEMSPDSPDNPPWIQKGAIEKSYSLMHADVGIAADYRKRRYVIRLRLEEHQFLLSCVELETFLRWLDHLNTAIGVAAPIDERTFPRDQTIPRFLRHRWLVGQSRTILGTDTQASLELGTESQLDLAVIPAREVTRSLGHIPRLHATSHPNGRGLVDPETGKWAPTIHWTETHDCLYAKLCYSVLLFKSPRKSNYVVSGGKRWYVDWNTGRMVRVLPPPYHEVEFSRPWKVLDGDGHGRI